MIKLSLINNHPENPRKDLGDLSELSESLKKQGILQNLTIIPAEDKPGEYYALIGNRRTAAAKLAGIDEAPCIIKTGLSKKEQLSIMLEENMQRNDLTVIEQAQSFQLMLDLGETEDSIAQKTGFSKKTIRQRLNIAKLDADTLKEKENDGFQLTIKALCQLENVSSIDTRNEILKNAKSEEDLNWRIASAANAEKREANFEKLKILLEKMGIEKAPSNIEKDRYTSKIKQVKYISLDDDVSDNIEIEITAPVETLYYFKNVSSLDIVCKRPPEKKEKTPYELERERKNSNRKKAGEILKEVGNQRKVFINSVISGAITVKDTPNFKDRVWELLLDNELYLSKPSLGSFFTEKSEYYLTSEEKEELSAKLSNCSISQQIMIALSKTLSSLENNLVKWDGTYDESNAIKLKKGYGVLKEYGWCIEIEDEAKKLIDGTSELYEPVKVDEKVDDNSEESEE